MKTKKVISEIRTQEVTENNQFPPKTQPRKYQDLTQEHGKNTRQSGSRGPSE
jgi:hypothetical protein